MERGSINADLGAGVFKQRIAREGQGKSGGYRVIVFYKIGQLAFFIHGFLKSEQENITPIQKAAFKDMSKLYFGLSEKELNQLIATKEFTEIEYYEKEQ